jgi:hypothetical protein
MTSDAMAMTPKSSGTSKRARISVLTKPIKRSVHRIATVISALSATLWGR